MTLFKIATTNGIQQVKGEPVNIGPIKCFVHEKDGFHIVVELSTGMAVCADIFMEYAIDGAKDLFNEHSEHVWRKEAQGKLRHAGITYPVNI